MKIIEKAYKVYSFDELNDTSKEIVLDDFRTKDLFFWDDEYKNTLDKFCYEFNVDWKEYDYTYGHHISYDLKVDKDIKNLQGIRLYKWLINNKEQEINKFKECNMTGFCADYDIIKPILEFLEKPSKYITLEDLIKDCLYSWLKAIQADYEFQYSKQGIKELIECNEYQFLEDGTFFEG